MNQYANFAIIRGHPLTIFVAMNLLGGYATYTQIEYWCKLSRPTIRKAMFPLLQLGLIKPVTQSKFMVNDYSEQTKMFAEKFFHLSSSSLINIESIDILSIESTTTTSCKTFSALPEVVEYLKSKGVWAESIPEIAKMAENDLVYLKSQFEGVDAALAIYRIKNAIPSEDVQKAPQEDRDFRRFTKGKYAEYINRGEEDD